MPIPAGACYSLLAMKVEALNTANAEHYIWGDACDGWHLIKSQELSIIEERMPPHTAERRHVHSKADQFFYILSGEAQMEIEGQIVTLSTRNGVFIQHGRTHKISNESDQDVIFLVISRPTTRGDREECE
jgi:mannose-6-phosphate isomerase-like protein (cupin superfamily)